MKKIYMLDTNICSFIMRERPSEVIMKLQQCIEKQNQIVISAITYSEMRFGAIGKKTSPKHIHLVNEFVKRLDSILAWDSFAVDMTTEIKANLAKLGTPIGNNDLAIAGHAISANVTLVTNNTSEFKRIKNLKLEDWVNV